MRFEIEPKIGLGNFILGMNINQVLTFVKRNGYYFQHCKIISNKEKNTPIFLHIPSELITLRFNYYSQNLELIEKRFIFDKESKDYSELNPDSEYYYKNKLFYLKNKTNEFHIIKYQDIAQLFRLSKVPKKLNNNKNNFLEFSGIGFYFTNNVIDLEKSEDLDISADASSVDTNSILTKFFIFKEDSLYDSLINKNIFSNNNILIKYDTNKAKSITINKSIISIGDNIEDVLRELKNPNYIYYCNDDSVNYNYNQNQENGSVLYNQTTNKMFYLNYFKYGIDIMICNNKVNRIILHTNQIGDSKFGIYERCNFELKLRKDYLTSLNKINDTIKEVNNEKIINNNKTEKITVKEDKEKEKNNSRKNSENNEIKANDKKQIKEKIENKSKLDKKEVQNNYNDNNEKNKLKENEKNVKNEQNKIIDNNKTSENKDSLKFSEKNSINGNGGKENKKSNDENLDEKLINNIKKEKKENEVIKEQINNKEKVEDKNLKDDKDNKNNEEKIQNEKNTLSEKENLNNEITKDKEDNKENTEKELKEEKNEENEGEKVIEKGEKKEKEDKEEEEQKEEEKKEEEKKEEEKKEEEKKDEEKKEEEKKEEEKKEEEKKDEEKKEEVDKQLQKNSFYSSKNSRRRRKKHGNPPKRKKEINSEEEEEDKKENEENENKKKEISEKGNIEESITIFPWSDFKEDFLSKIEYNKNLRHQKWDEGTSKIINCYFFNGLLFEIIDKNIIGTVIIY